MQNKCFIMYRYEIGGCESVFVNIANTLTDQTIELITVVPVYNSKLINNLPQNVRLISHQNIPILNSCGFLLKNSVAQYFYCALSILILPIFLKLLNKRKKVTYINFSDTLSSLLVAILASKKKSTISWIQSQPYALTRSKCKTLLFFLYRRCKKIIFICHDQRDAFKKINPLPERVICDVVYNPIDVEEIKLKMTEKVDCTKPYICMVSRLDEFSKDFYTPLKAFALMPQYIKDRYSVVIIGDGPDKGKIEQYIEDLNLKGKIFLKGSDLNPFKWMYNADLFLFSSKSEGLGLVILEAMATDCYVIATDSRVGPREILESKGCCGSIVPVGDEVAMAKEIEDYIYNKIDIQTRKHNARMRLNDFSKKSFKKQLDIVFYE